MERKEIAKTVKEMREETGDGMMDCKRALELNDFNKEKALKYLEETAEERCFRRRYI